MAEPVRDAESVANYQYGLMLDCDVEGCEPYHGDHGRIFPVGRGTPPEPPWEIMGHGATPVRRPLGQWAPDLDLIAKYVHHDWAKPCGDPACGCARTDGRVSPDSDQTGALIDGEA